MEKTVSQTISGPTDDEWRTDDWRTDDWRTLDGEIRTTDNGLQKADGDGGQWTCSLGTRALEFNPICTYEKWDRTTPLSQSLIVTQASLRLHRPLQPHSFARDFLFHFDRPLLPHSFAREFLFHLHRPLLPHSLARDFLYHSTIRSYVW